MYTNTQRDWQRNWRRAQRGLLLEQRKSELITCTLGLATELATCTTGLPDVHTTELLQNWQLQCKRDWRTADGTGQETLATELGGDMRMAGTAAAAAAAASARKRLRL